MDIKKSRGVIAVLVGLTLSSLGSSAEAPARGVPQVVVRQPAMQGLSNPALKLTASQQARIDTIVAAYLAEEKERGNSLAADPQRGREAALASKQARERMMAAVDQVLDVSQRNTLKAEQAEQKAKLAQAMEAAYPVPPPALPRAPAGTNQPQGR
jgi:hypothetical protein